MELHDGVVHDSVACGAGEKACEGTGCHNLQDGGTGAGEKRAEMAWRHYWLGSGVKEKTGGRGK